jgi:hypothetical protein
MIEVAYLLQDSKKIMRFERQFKFFLNNIERLGGGGKPVFFGPRLYRRLFIFKSFGFLNPDGSKRVKTE